MAGSVGTTESAVSAVFGPVTIGPATGPNILTGSVTFPGTATGPLYVGAFDMSTGTMRAARIASPTRPQFYTVTGIPAGDYFVFAIVDMNDNGVVDGGDLSNTREDGQVVPIDVATTQDVTLSNANAGVRIATSHQIQQGVPGSDFYAIRSRVAGRVKLPVAVTLYSGPNAAVPADIARSWDFDLWSGLGSTRPAAGDAYRFKVWYSDGTSELKSGSVSGVLDSFAESLSVTPTPSANVPTFNWAAPASPPASYTYRLSLDGPGASWWYPQDAGMPSTQTSVQYNVDGRASPSSLVMGTTYGWSVIVEDPGRNQASVRTTYTP